MSNVAKHPWIIFGGSDGKTTKGVALGWNPVFSHWACNIYELKEPVETGAEWTKDDIQNHITSLVFSTRDSLDCFIDALDKLGEKWDEADMAMDMERSGGI